MKITRTWLWIIPGLIGAVIANAVVSYLMREIRRTGPSATEMDAKFEEAVQKGVEMIRPTLPKKMDEWTTWISVDAIGKNVFYVYSIDIDLLLVPEEQKSKFLTKQRAEFANHACSEKPMRTAMDHGGGYNYVLLDKRNRSIGVIEIRKGDC